MLSISTLSAIFPPTPRATLEELIEPLDKCLAKIGLKTKTEIAAFLAQVGHESGNFKFKSENLNYGMAGLQGVFGKYFTAAMAKAYARNPEKIANRVYANRMGNGNEASGDGWRYRGGGFIQVTGKSNYTALAAWLGKTVEETLIYIRTTEGALMSAAWFWIVNGLKPLSGDMQALTKRINGGLNGIADRLAIYHRALQAL